MCPTNRKQVRQFLLALLFTLGLLLGASPALAANPAPVQLFYVTLPEGDALTAIDTIAGTSGDAYSPVYTYFSIAIGVDNTLVYYDQWEDGYAGDIANPATAEIYSAGNPDGVQIWGNGVAADGCAPNINGVAFTCTDANDDLDAGDVVIPYNSVVVPNGSSTIEFDAMDKVGASASIAMARAVWASGTSTLNAFAHEMYATAEWDTIYESPVGTNTAGDGTSMFQYSALSIMASQNNTTVEIDSNADGTMDQTVTLQEGKTTLVTGIRQGARVVADKPVQVLLLTGDIDDGFESRDINLLPVSAYGHSYWSPVGDENNNDSYNSNPTRLWLYNPSANPSIYVTCERYGVANVRLGPVAARGVVTVDLVDNQGAHCYASYADQSARTDVNIFGVGTVDTASGDDGGADGSRSDWSFTLYPDSFLSTDALVGLGLGKNPNNTTSTENGSPLWVTPACTGGTWVYVDWNNDGTADAVDTNGDGSAETGTQNGIFVNYLRSMRLFEPTLDTEPYDQSGARVWSRTASGVGRDGTPGCALALAWGQNTATASAAEPALDVGTSVPPLRLFEGTKTLLVVDDTAPVGVLNPGDKVQYTISIKNTGTLTVNNVYVSDELPANTTYVAGSTYKNVGSGWVSIADDGSGTPFPLDGSGVPLGNLAAGATFYVRFDVTLDVENYEDITNCAAVVTAAGTLDDICVTTPVSTRDWGDLPDSYGTSATANGPRHSDSGLYLGSLFDIEAQGVPTTDAQGDDVATSDDEDGVVLNVRWVDLQLGNGSFDVTVTGGSGYLNVWLDWNRDGDFNDAIDGLTEQIVTDLLLAAGTHTVNFSMPPNQLTVDGDNIMNFRFRLDPSGGIGPTGFVAGGEVEDHQKVVGPAPEAVTIAGASATPGLGGVLLQWETGSEVSNLGFNLYRGRTGDIADAVKLNSELIPSQAFGSIVGASYAYTDETAKPGVAYTYWLEDVEAISSGIIGPDLAHLTLIGEGKWNMPKTVKVFPFEGSVLALSGQRFGAFFQDKDGDLAYGYLLINSVPELQGGLAVRYEVASGLMSMYDQRISQWLPGLAPGVADSLGCPFGALRAYGSSVEFRDDGIIAARFQLKFWARFVGEHQLWLMAEDAAGNTTGWQPYGPWTVLAAP